MRLRYWGPIACGRWAGIAVCVAVVLLWAPSPLGRAAEVLSLNERIEADWVRQDVARELQGKPSPVDTRADAAGGVDGVTNGAWGFHTSDDASSWRRNER